MIRTVTALFDDTDEAEAAFDGLSRRISVMKGAIVTCGPGERPDFGAIYLSRAQREACEAELAGGGSLLIVQVEGDSAAEQAVALLDRHAGGGEPAPPPAGFARQAPDPAAPAAAAEAKPPPAMPQLSAAAPARGVVEGVPISTESRRAIPAATASLREPEPATEPKAEAEPEVQVIPVVEEELRVGKRSTLRGGARVHSYMEEVPVTQQVELKEERATVERRPVNRRLSEEEIAASGLLQDRVIEVAQVREEAIVTKQAYVREELIVKKAVETRVEQISETVRRTAVEVERLEAAQAGDRKGPARGG